MIDPQQLFSLSSPLAILGWLCLVLAPFMPRVSDIVACIVIPTLFSIAYVALALAFWTNAPGGFQSLEQVMRLFTEPYIALAGWLHYLAFDLFVGAWIVRSARQQAILHWLLLPILAMTFLFGPAGFLAFMALRKVLRLRSGTASETEPDTPQPKTMIGGSTRYAVAEKLRRMYRDEPAFTTAGLLFLVLCVPTLLSLCLDLRQFQGNSIWLKPLKFELSLSLYLLTLAWFARYLPAGLVRKRAYRIHAGVVVAAATLEMLWIGCAAALGTASHFNVSTPVWQMTYAFMGVMAVTLTSPTLLYGICIWRQKQTVLARPLHIAISTGLILTFFMTVSNAGTLSSGTGHLVGVPVSDGRLPILGWSTEVGDLRAPHFFATHAMQFIPLMTLLSGTHRVSVAWIVAAAYSVVTLATFLVSLDGLLAGNRRQSSQV